MLANSNINQNEVQLDNGYLSNGLSQNKVHQSEIKPNGNNVVPYVPTVPPSFPQLDDKLLLNPLLIPSFVPSQNFVHPLEHKSSDLNQSECESLNKQIKELELKHNENEPLVYKCEQDSDNNHIIIDLSEKKEQPSKDKLESLENKNDHDVNV